MRELENILERALTLCDGNEITPFDLQLPGGRTSSDMGDSPAAADAKRESETLDDFLSFVNMADEVGVGRPDERHQSGHVRPGHAGSIGGTVVTAGYAGTHIARITSYNVCYTKLLRSRCNR